jgi:hypothetical protein
MTNPTEIYGASGINRYPQIKVGNGWNRTSFLPHGYPQGYAIGLS